MRFKKDLLEALCEAAKNTYPDEFIALLSVKKDKELVEEFVAVPATFGKNFASYRLDLLPIDASIIGTIHSHPSRNASPSNADLRVFSRGKVNLIIPFPFEVQSIKAFDSKGKTVDFEVVD